MIILIAAAFFACISPTPALLKKASTFAHIQQSKCDEFLSWKMEHQDSLTALLCGTDLSNKNHKELLKKSSLIHIFVVSGAHLLFLDQFLSMLRIPLFVRFPTWLLYSVLAGWQAPIVRAFMQLSLRAGLRIRGLYFPADLAVLLAGVLGIALFPEWAHSLSYQMSWCASLALSYGAFFRHHSSFRKAVFTQLGIYLCMVPLLYGLGNLHPLSVLFNLTLGNFVALFILPLALLASTFPALRPSFDFLLESFFFLVSHLTAPIQQESAPLLSREILWAWIALLHLLCFLFRKKFFQGRDYSS